MKLFKLLIPSTLALLFMVSTAFGQGFETYTVQNGDTLHKIAEKTLKDPKYIKQLLAYNQITKVQGVVVPGKTLKVPYSLSKNRAARLTTVVGNVQVSKGGKAQKAQTNMYLLQSDEIITAPGSKAEIQLDEGSVVRVGPATKFSLAKYSYNEGSRDTNLDLKKGSMSMKVTKLTGGSDFKVSTVTAVAGVRGTFFYVNYDPESNEVGVAVYSGEVEVGSSDEKTGELTGSVKVPAGHATTVTKSGTPSPIFEIPGKIEWAE